MSDTYQWTNWGKAFEGARRLGARLVLEVDLDAWCRAITELALLRALGVPSDAVFQVAFREGRLERYAPDGACVVLVRAGGPAALVSQQEEMRRATDLANGRESERFS